jgi:hypothetical protein
MRFQTKLSTAMVVMILAASAISAQQRRVQVGGDIKAPTQTKYVAPIYPANTPTVGDVKVPVDLVIGIDGSIRDLRIFLRPGSPFKEPAIAAVKQWKYTPTLIDGQAVEVEMSLDVIFKPPSAR